ncbi:hypothetical protein [Glycomyces terrestris]|uniref:Uncharacterized protein n=1 Tax=Glycomyces terrestris TaxID=2493553 RepID=A0A426UXG3_9ACTN|nr:hypothetical protein [Glycomyces terrestris]RRR99321.1 hypothetical protein EIW28_11400 [Glycomyces terrestris]
MDIRFYRDADGSTKYEVGDRKRYAALGMWLSWDVDLSFTACLDALRAVDDAASGRDADAGFEGNEFDIAMNSREAVFRNLHADQVPPSTYPIAEVRSATEAFWRFLLTVPANPNVTYEYRPDLPPHLASLLKWEEYWKRPHPYRGRIEGIPATGPA